MSEWIAKHPDELRPGLYVPVQALQEAEARFEALEAWCEQTNQDAYEKWKALEATEQGDSDE